MLVFWRQSLVFLATPKTGSTAIETALSPLAAVVVMRPPNLKHTNAQRYQRHIAPFPGDPKGSDFATTALMREPLDWLGSWYRYRQRNDEAAEKSTRSISFGDFVRAYCRPDQPEFAKIGAQATFLTPQGFRPVDHIFRYDRMDLFIRFVEQRLATRITLTKVNVSPAGPVILSPQVETLMRHHRAADFALYDSLR